MVWTEEEQELIAISDRFVADCTQSEKMKNINHYLLLQQILLSNKGNVKAIKKHCQKIIAPQTTDFSEPELFVVSSIQQPIAEKLINSDDKSDNHDNKKVQVATKKIRSFWAVLFILFSLVVIFFSAKRSPNLSSNETFSNVATFCPAGLIEKAQQGVINHDKLMLEEAIASLQELKQQQANRLGAECEQILWETQYVYAIDFLASKGQRKPAAETLCSIPPQYYQNKEIIPWFTRWSNTNADFSQWLQQYKITNDCPVANYLE